jgi:hypothetical protein
MGLPGWFKIFFSTRKNAPRIDVSKIPSPMKEIPVRYYTRYEMLVRYGTQSKKIRPKYYALKKELDYLLINVKSPGVNIDLLKSKIEKVRKESLVFNGGVVDLREHLSSFNKRYSETQYDLGSKINNEIVSLNKMKTYINNSLKQIERYVLIK